MIQPLVATGTYSDGSTQDLSGTATWISSVAGVATLATGDCLNEVATAASVGTTTITATDPTTSISGSAALTVTADTGAMVLLQFTVQDPNGTVLTPGNSGAGAQVSGPGFSAYAVEDCDGNFALLVPTGQVQLALTYTEVGEVWSTGIALPSNMILGGNIDVTASSVWAFTMPSSAITVNVEDSTGSVVPGSQVVLQQGGTLDSCPAPFTSGCSATVTSTVDVNGNEPPYTDPAGSVTLYGVLGIATTQVDVDTPVSANLPYEQFEVLDAQSSTILVQFPEGAQLTVQFLDPAGNAITPANASTYLLLSYYMAPAGGFFNTQLPPDGVGRYSTVVPIGQVSISLSVTSPSAALELPETIAFAATLDVPFSESVGLTLPTQPFTLKVSDPNGNPVSGATVTVAANATSPLSCGAAFASCSISNDQAAPPTTDATGLTTFYDFATPLMQVSVTPPSGPPVTYQLDVFDGTQSSTFNVQLPWSSTCLDGSCLSTFSGCIIAGTPYYSGNLNPAIACQSCQPASSTTAWSNVADGTSCGSGEVCSGGSCDAGCYVGGAYYASGAVNPSSACQICVPGTSTTAFTNAANGTSCGGACVNGQTDPNNCGGCGVACAANQPCNAGACEVVPVDASAQALWESAAGPGPMSVLSNGNVLVWQSQQVFSAMTGAITTITPSFPDDGQYYGSWGAMPMIFPNAGTDAVFSSSENMHVFTAGGAWVWSWLGPGCCNYVQSYAYDNTNNVIWTSAWYGAANPIYTTPAFVGSSADTPANDPLGSHLALTDGNLYFAGFNGDAAMVNLSTNVQSWRVPVDTTSGLRYGAVAGDGSFVVTSTAANAGVLAEISLAGQTVFSLNVGANTEPVVAASGAIFVGTSNGTSTLVQSYSSAGALVWSTPVHAAPTDVLLGDDGQVYAFLSSTPGEIVGLSEANGALTHDYINLESGGEMRLSNGVLFAHTNSHMYALPTSANNYNPADPWPVKQHDNKLQSSRPAQAAVSCLTMLTANPAATSGVYEIDPDGPGGLAPFDVFCDMTTDGGGWTMLPLLFDNPSYWSITYPGNSCLTVDMLDNQGDYRQYLNNNGGAWSQTYMQFVPPIPVTTIQFVNFAYTNSSPQNSMDFTIGAESSNPTYEAWYFVDASLSPVGYTFATDAACLAAGGDYQIIGGVTCSRDDLGPPIPTPLFDLNETIVLSATVPNFNMALTQGCQSYLGEQFQIGTPPNANGIWQAGIAVR